MLGSRKYKGLRLSTKLILTYSFVALSAVVASGAVALPLLQSYQDGRTDEERQRVILEYTDKVDTVRSTILNRTSNLNPFHDYLVTNPNAVSNAKTWPETPSIDVIRQKFRDLAQARDVRLLVLINGESEVAVDTEADPTMSLQDKTLTDGRYSRPTQQPGAIRQPPWDGTITLANGQEYDLLFREISGDNAPNLFGLTNRGKPLTFIIATIKPRVIAPEAWKDLAPILGIAAVPALLVSFILGLFLARSMSRPLVRLTNATQAVARGDYEHRVSPEGGYELNRLAESFNQMTHAVDESQRMQRQLIANVSHELKTPLTSIQGFSQAMLDGALRRPEDFERPAEIISQEAARMVRLVNGLLDLSKLETGQITLQLVEMDLAEMLRYCIESFNPSAELGQVALVADFKSPLMLKADNDRLRQVFNNLIDNALKYTPPGGVIQVSAHKSGNIILASVSDSGSGIPAVDLPHVFERFYQADKSRRRDLIDKGTGLGLAISKEIVMAHGGKIEATSVEGKGTQFNIILPALVNNISQTTLLSGSKNNPDIELVKNK